MYRKAPLLVPESDKFSNENNSLNISYIKTLKSLATTLLKSVFYKTNTLSSKKIIEFENSLTPPQVLKAGSSGIKCFNSISINIR